MMAMLLGLAVTVDDLIEWLESAKRQNPDRDIGGYKVNVPYNSSHDGPIQDGKVDHDKNSILFWSD